MIIYILNLTDVYCLNCEPLRTSKREKIVTSIIKQDSFNRRYDFLSGIPTGVVRLADLVIINSFEMLNGLIMHTICQQTSL